MSRGTCGATHDTENWTCILPAGRHSAHTDGANVWDDPEIATERARAPKKTTGRRRGGATEESMERLRSMSARPEGRVNPLADPINRPSPEIPAEAETRWRIEDDVWLSQAEAVVKRFLKEHREPFTTPEAIWPLLDKPREMRAFSLVVRTALRREWIEETGAVRLRGTYTTRDGHQFLMNKLVPIYRSRLA